jgi:hypothetical protein
VAVGGGAVVLVWETTAVDNGVEKQLVLEKLQLACSRLRDWEGSGVEAVG